MGRSATLGRRVGERYRTISNMDFPTPLSHLVVRLVLAVDHGRTTSCDLDSRNNMLDTSNLSSNMLNNDLGEERLRGREERRATGERVRSRSLKRTESFV